MKSIVARYDSRQLSASASLAAVQFRGGLHEVEQSGDDEWGRLLATVFSHRRREGAAYLAQQYGVP